MNNKIMLYVILALASLGISVISVLVWQTIKLQKRLDSYQNAIIQAQNQLAQEFNNSLEVLSDGNQEKIIEKQRVIERIKPVKEKISFGHLGILRGTYDRLFKQSTDSSRAKNSDITQADNPGIYARRQ